MDYARVSEMAAVWVDDYALGVWTDLWAEDSYYAGLTLCL